MAHDTLPLAVRLAAFGLAVLPLLLDNLRSGRAANRNTLILFLGGLAMLALDAAMGWSGRSLTAAGGWIAGGALGLVALSALGGVPAGIAKILIAFLPWFGLGGYLVVVTAGFLLTALVSYVTRRDAPLVMPLALAGLVVRLYDFGAGAAG